MGLYNYDSTEIPKSDRIPKLVENLYAKMPEIESARAILITESYRQTENEPMVIRRAKAFAHILENIPIVIPYDVFRKIFAILYICKKSCCHEKSRSIKYFSLGSRKKKTVSYLMKLYRVIKDNKYDVVHINGNSPGAARKERQPASAFRWFCRWCTGCSGCPKHSTPVHIYHRCDLDHSLFDRCIQSGKFQKRTCDHGNP